MRSCPGLALFASIRSSMKVRKPSENLGLRPARLLFHPSGEEKMREFVADRVPLRAIVVAMSALLVGCQGPESAGGASSSGVDREAVDPDTPGVRETGPGQYDAVIFAFEGGFGPNEIRVPVGAEVRFRVRSADVPHGILIAGTDIALEADIHAFSEATHTFTEEGEYLFECQIYCIGGHDEMGGRVIVE